MDRNSSAKGCVAALQFLADERQRSGVPSAAAVFFWDADPHQAKIGEFFDHFWIKCPVAIPLGHIRHNFLINKVSHCLSEQLLFFVEFKIHTILSLCHLFSVGLESLRYVRLP